MRPITKTFLLLLIRHLTGILKAFEEWVKES